MVEDVEDVGEVESAIGIDMASRNGDQKHELCGLAETQQGVPNLAVTHQDRILETEE